MKSSMRCVIFVLLVLFTTLDCRVIPYRVRNPGSNKISVGDHESTHHDTLPFVDGSEGNNKISFEQLRNKIEHERLPLFEFKNDIESIVRDEVTGIELENIISEYFIALRNHYYRDFVHSYRMIFSSRRSMEKMKKKILLECETAMKKSIPDSLREQYSYSVSFLFLFLL
jgi:hypothetical protein